MKRLVLLLLGASALASCASMTDATTDAHSRAYADFLIGRVANLRDDHRVALDRYNAALRASPGDPNLIEGGVRAALALGDVEAARTLARQDDSHGGGAPAAAIVRGADALRAGRWNQARGELAQVSGDLDEQFAARILTVWAKAGAGRVDEAIQDLDRLSAPRPFSGVFLFQQAMALDLGGRNDEALAAYTRAEGEGLWLAPALMRHVDLLVRMNRRDQAIALLRSWDEDSNSPEIDAALAALTGGGAPAQPQLTAARGAAIGLYGLGALISQQAEPDDGLGMLSLSLLVDPSLEAAQVALAETFRDLDQYAAARTALAAIPAQSPYSETSKLMSAWILNDEGRASDAVETARLAAASGGVRAQTAYADLLRSAERYGEAEPLYTQLIAASPNDWRLYFARGVTRERLSHWDDAQADLQHALQLSPNQPDVMNYLGYTWVDRGEHLDEGLQILSRAAELRPNSGAIIDSLGWAHYRLGHYQQALGYLERAVELEPGDPTLNDHLGDLYWQLGRRIEARFQWRRVLTLSPDDSLRAAAEHKVADGLAALPLAENRR